MKHELHPKFNDVIFQDVSCGEFFKTKSTITSKETYKWEDGKEYPLIRVDISSASHPFYTGKQKVLDTEGRIERFRKKYAKK